MGNILRKGFVICIVLTLASTIFAGLPMNVAAAGDGTLENPYQITDVWELQAIKDDLDAHYILMNDIDASDTVNWNSGAGFQPIGDDFAQFRGTFDGNNYKITGLFINRPSTNNIGLFGRAYIAEIKNVGLKDVQITGGNAVGSVIGFNYGTPISNAYATGTVSGQFGVGGLIGYNDNGVIEYSYSTCSVSGTWWYTGGLVGYSLGGYGISCYWDTQTSGQAYSAMGTGKTTVQMKAQATFVGWDFTNTWGIDEGVTYPYFIHPPVADAGSDQTVMVEETVYLDGSGSYDVDGTIESYIWDFGDTNSGSGETTTHAYTAVGIYTVTLTVTDNGGATDTDTITITVKTPLEATSDLITEGQGMGLPDGIENSFVSKLDNAIKSLTYDRPSAEGQLGAFINEVEAQRGLSLTTEQADALIAYAQWIIDNL